MWFNTFFARRYALGGSILAGLALLLGFKFMDLAFRGLTSGEHFLGLLRAYLVLALVFIPWFLLTWFTRLRVQGDVVEWRQLPFACTFNLADVTSVSVLPLQGPGSVPRLAIEYTKAGVARRVTLTPHIFPVEDVRSFLHALQGRRGDLAVPTFPL